MMYAQRTKSYAAAALADVDGILQAAATQTSAAEYLPAGFDGAAIGAGGLLDLPRIITITASDNAGQFSTDDIVVTGQRGSSEVTQTLNLASVNGNETLRSTQIFDFVTSVAFPVMGGTGGTLSIGVEDICAPYNSEFIGVELAATGVLNLRYGGANTDAIPVGAAQVGFVKPVRFQRLLTNPGLAAPTTVGVTVYLP